MFCRTGRYSVVVCSSALMRSSCVGILQYLCLGVWPVYEFYYNMICVVMALPLLSSGGLSMSSDI